MNSTKQSISDTEFTSQLNDLDLDLFKNIPSQSTENDKRSLLACQLAVRNYLDSYTYLEIGSYLGGSLQPYLLDEKCNKIYSIDKRPFRQADERGTDYIYKNNSTDRMIENLRQISPQNVGKISCLDGDASEISTGKIAPKPNLCFIDGEHTDAAAMNDFQFCLKVIEPNGIILFHDAMVIYNGLSKIIEFLEANKINFRAYNLPDVVFVIELGDFSIQRDPHIENFLLNNHLGYLSSLQMNDYYRRFVNKPVIRHYRNFRAWLSGGNVSK